MFCTRWHWLNKLCRDCRRESQEAKKLLFVLLTKSLEILLSFYAYLLKKHLQTLNIVFVVTWTLAATCSPFCLFSPNNQPFVDAVTSSPADSNIKHIKAQIIPFAFVLMTIAITNTRENRKKRIYVYEIKMIIILLYFFSGLFVFDT